MRYLAVLFFTHLAVSSSAKKSADQLPDFNSIPKELENLLMPSVESGNISVDFTDTLAETMKFFRSMLMDALRDQGTEIGDGIVENVQKANYKLQQSIKTLTPFYAESILLDNDLQELTDQLKIFLELTPDAEENSDSILNDDVLETCRTIVNGVYQQKHLIRSNVKPITWKSFQETGDRILTDLESCSASEGC